ncbi:hypothetical protein OSTOST_03316 [Ostertagia ostertagi]
MNKVVFVLALCDMVFCLTREELLEHLKSKQETQSTFDARVPRLIRPIGYVNEEEVITKKVFYYTSIDAKQGSCEDDKAEMQLQVIELAFNILTGQNDNRSDSQPLRVAPHRDAVALIRKMDKEQNYNRVLQFLEKFT